MTKEQVIYTRDTIKGGDNIPVRVSTDGGICLVDEGNAAQLVHWDDDNELLIVWRLADIQTDLYPNNEGKYISMSVVAYSEIFVIEMAYLSVDFVQNRMEAFGVGSKYAENATKMFKQLLRSDIANLRHEDYNRIMGAMFLNSQEEYYDGRYKENFKETRSTAANNKYVDELRAAAAAESEEEDSDDESGD